MQNKRILALVFVALPTLWASAQSSSEIQKEIQRLNEFKKVMYVAAHPDDENTRVIAWLSRGRNAYVRYLSLTRGDGGQNMIGTELGAELGILRTQELLAARRIDGGSQAFTRAVDFGYSKTADETIELWDKRKVLGDVVRAIRTFKPDVIVTRFPPDDRGGHGHHTASAMLAIEAFDLAGSDTAFVDQLDLLDTWQPQSIYWNTYSWRWDPNLDSLATHDPRYFKQDVGGYDPYLGVSYNELASLARSQHRCQGFGVSISRGEAYEYFQHLDGEMLESDLLENIDRSWESLGGTSAMQQLVQSIASEFDPQDPAGSLPKLLELRQALSVSDMEDHWREIKLAEVDELIAMCSGLHAEATSENYSEVAGSMPDVNFRIMPRSVDDLVLTKISYRSFPNGEGDLSFDSFPRILLRNEYAEFEYFLLGARMISQPYWLRQPFTTTYSVEHKSLIGMPENPPEYLITFTLEYQNMPFEMTVPLDYRWSDRVDGEQRRPFVSSPKATAGFDEDVFIFADDSPNDVRVRVRSFKEDFSTSLGLDVPEGWSYEPEVVALDFDNKYEERVVTFSVYPPEDASEGILRPTLEFVEEPVQQFSEIAYDHIPTQVVFGESRAKVVRLSLVIDPGKIGYIQGAGDEVDVAIEQMGFEVDRLTESDLAAKASLSEYQSIVIGIRAYNVHPWLLNYRDKLMKYVEEGGNLIVQYNTATRDLLTSDIGPYPLTLSRQRVTEEDAKASIIDPAHPYFNIPNKITAADFDGWVQERGLYFASDWDDHYQPLISWHDKDEPARIGGLLFAPYGDGSFTYVGISFFRELPAGVPGAFRILANILSYE